MYKIASEFHFAFDPLQNERIGGRGTEGTICIEHSRKSVVIQIYYASSHIF